MAIDAHTTRLRIVAADDNETILDLDPIQGLWTEKQYLQLTNYSRRLIEFTDGSLKVLPMPTHRHQAILGFLYRVLYPFMQQFGGTVLFAALRMQIREGKFREPDLLLVLDANDPRVQNAYWLGADLVMEVVSPDDPERDTKVKRADYAEAGIPEYWIVNPEDESITVLRLEGDKYTEHGIFYRSDTATSALLEGFAVLVKDVFDAR